MSPERLFEVLAQNTPQIILCSLLKLPFLGYAEFEYAALMQMSCCSPRRGRSFKSSSSALAVLAFANQHSTISTQACYLYRIRTVSKSVI